MAATFGLFCGAYDAEPQLRKPRRVELVAMAEKRSLTGIERLCYDLVLDAILTAVEGDEESRWWLFEEGVRPGMSKSALPFAEVCLILEISPDRLRRRIRPWMLEKRLGKVEARGLIAQQAGFREKGMVACLR